MELAGDVLCNLIKWLDTLDLNAKHGTLSELSDGVAMAEALTQIDPDFFTPDWNSKIKIDVGDNWRLKLSNLRKILDRVFNYHQDVLNVSLTEFSGPEVENIAKTVDSSDLEKLLILILSCAVNCEKKVEYKCSIMEMEPSCRRSIMQVIQELETLKLCGSRVMPLEPTKQSEHTEDMREALAQRCHDLDKQVKILEEEKTSLQDELSRLQEERQTSGKIEIQFNDQKGRADALERELTAAKLRIHSLESELENANAQGAKVVELERKIEMIQQKNAELQESQHRVTSLRDERDVLSETAAKVPILQNQIESYKKRMLNYDELKRQVEILKSENQDYNRIAAERRQEALQLQDYSDQLNQVKQQNKDLIEKITKFEVDNQQLSIQAAWLRNNVDELRQQRDTLKKELEELKCSSIVADANLNPVSCELTSSNDEVLLEDFMIQLEGLQTAKPEVKQTIKVSKATQSDSQKECSRCGILEKESRLVGYAWHQFGVRYHRDAVDTRMHNMRMLSVGNTFLARQRKEPSRT